jgi:PAS domain S-box-containing protein
VTEVERAQPGSGPAGAGARSAGRWPGDVAGGFMLADPHVEPDLARIIFNSIREGVFTVDPKFTITSFNPAAERITGFAAAHAIGKPCFEIFRTEICHTLCPLRNTLRNRAPVENARVTIINHDGVEKPISLSTAALEAGPGEIVGAVELFHDLTEVEHLRRCLGREQILDRIVSGSEAMRRTIQLLPNIAESECNVLIEGPSGSGKEIVAQAIHSLSPRCYGPYIKLNCAALPATLLESELFGYAKGAFTDAKRDKPGQFALANGGTLLLDEIGEMDIALQVKLLRVLNDGEYQPLGSTRPLRTDARIIAATNADLEASIAAGRFREDLYYRINVVTVQLPALKDRPEDIPLLVTRFLSQFAQKTGKPIDRLTGAAMNALRRYPFPGNVRELENAIEHAFVMCTGREIEPVHLPRRITCESGCPAAGSTALGGGERERIETALRRCLGDRARAARELGMHRSTLWRKIVRLEIPH